MPSESVAALVQKELQSHDGSFDGDITKPIEPKPSSRPKSARLYERGRGNRRPGSRQASVSKLQPMSSKPTTQSIDGLSAKSMDRQHSGGVSAFGTSSAGRRCPSPSYCFGKECDTDKERCPQCGSKQAFEVVSALMMSVLYTYKHREHEGLLTALMAPLKELVPCEDVKVVVRCIGPPPQGDIASGPFDPTIKRLKRVTYVEKWSTQKIDGQAAVAQRIFRIPSQENNRHHWDQYEVPKGQMDSLRNLVAVPLFDAESNVLAVVKLMNRRTPDGSPIAEFSNADLTTLSAFAAIFACIIPHPYLGLPGAGLQRRPQARAVLSDNGIGAVVSWQVPKELKGLLIHEIRYTHVEHDDEYVGHSPQENWSIMPCGLLDPLPGPEDTDANYEFTVPNLRADSAYVFSVRLRNQRIELPWSESSIKLSTFLAPPHSMTNETVQLFPLSETMVQVEWTPFDTCDPNMQLIEYRVTAHTVFPSEVQSESPNHKAMQTSSKIAGLELTDEQVVAVFISDGTKLRESVIVANLLANMTYHFAVEARYPLVGVRSFACGLMSDKFSFPTIDITLPAPQPVAADCVLEGPAVVPYDAAAPVMESILIKWPYPADLTPQLVLQYRIAMVVTDGHDNSTAARRIALRTSPWANVRASNCLHAQLVDDGATSDVRMFRETTLQGSLAAQLRVIKTPHGTIASPPSAWFFPEPPAPPRQVVVKCAFNDDDGASAQIIWVDCSDPVFDNDAGSRDLGPISYAVQHDFSRGNGPCATRFQVRMRAVTAAGDPRSDWERILPEFLPAKCKHFPSNLLRFFDASESQGSCYQWFLHEQRWFTQPGATFELQLRLGNALFWSSWVTANTFLHIQAEPPRTVPGDVLTCRDVRSDTVCLNWMPFIPSEDRLRALEYRIFCLELPESNDTRFEVGGRIVSWRMLDAVSAEVGAVAGSDSPGTKLESCMSYTVRSLVPERRYKFAVECRYLGLPTAIAAACAKRLEALDPLPRRGLQLVVDPNSIQAVAALAQRVNSQPISHQRGFVIQIRWRFHASPSNATLPTMFCYQLRCIPEAANTGHENVLLPPGMISQRGRSDGIGSFTIDRAREMTADIELCSGAIEAILPKQARLRFAVRLGELSPGVVSWSDWSDSLSDPVDLVVAPPARLEGSALSVTEQAWSIYGSDMLPPNASHVVEAVTLAWAPFKAPPGLTLEQHAQLIVQYEVICWVVHARAHSLEAVRLALASDNPSPNDVSDVFRQTTQPSKSDVSDDCRHYLRVPGESLQTSNYHFFQVRARYLFANGEPVPQRCGTHSASIVSDEPYRPTPRPMSPPRLEQFVTPRDDSSEPCALLLLPQDDASIDAEPLSIEYREGCVYGGQPDAELAVVASGEWTPVPETLVDRLRGDRPRVLIRQLQAQICQFRFRRGMIESQGSSWTDASVWTPLPISGPQLQLQMQRPSLSRTCRGGGRMHMQGLGIALGIGRSSHLYARLAWPRHAQQPSAVKLSWYQLRYKSQDEVWNILPVVELPSLDVATAESQVTELQHGKEYEFSLRLCNALGRWSEWSKPSVPLLLNLPAPAPTEALEKSAVLRLGNISPSSVRLSWRQFSIPRRSDMHSDPPILFDDAVESRGSLSAEYELAVCEDGGKIVRSIQLQGLVAFEEVPLDEEWAWLEKEVEVEPHKSYIFKIYARLPLGTWGPVLESAILPPRLMPIAVGSPIVDLLLRKNANDRMLEAVLHFEVSVRGFSRGRVQDTMDGIYQADRLAADISQYQLRSCPMAETGEQWCEWLAADAISVHKPSDRLLDFDIPVIAAASKFSPGSRYTFSMRCCDTYGRWSDWSPLSEPIYFKVPDLKPSLNDNWDGMNLRISPMGPKAVQLDWGAFRPEFESKELDAALQRVEYRICMTKRLAHGTSGWMKAPVTDFASERRSAQALTYTVTDLDERFEHMFQVSARWLDVPQALGAQTWTQEIASPMLASRLSALRAPQPPCVEVHASDVEGIVMLVKWCADPALRDIGNSPVLGARYQVRYAQVQEGRSPEDNQPLQDAKWKWETESPILEDNSQPADPELIHKVRGLLPGGTFLFSVRMGDNHRWTDWSSPSGPALVGVATPIPSPGDVLEISCDVGASAVVKLGWRPFRTSSSLTWVEYKIMALEWPFEDNSNDNGVLARLRRAAQESQAALTQGTTEPRAFNSLGYVTRQSVPGGKLRPTGDYVQWQAEGLKPGRYYRFFVCARYLCLPLGAMLPLPSTSGDVAHPQVYMWPDEYYERMRSDSISWEAFLSRCGLWSAVVNTAHMPQMRNLALAQVPILRDRVSREDEAATGQEQLPQLLNSSAMQIESWHR